MNSAIRLEKILLKIKETSDTQALKVFERVFETDGCMEVVQKLKLCESQVSIIKEKNENATTKYLDAIFSCINLSRDIRNERNAIDPHITSLEMVGHYMDTEEINKDNLTELYDLLVEMEDKFNKLNLSKQHKDIIIRYMKEISDAMYDLNIGGVNAFENHIVVANGTVVLYHEVFTSNGLSELTGKIYEKTTRIISDFQVWQGTLGFMGGLFFGK